jgi:DNA-directed RNA polymerase specialized sigma24 family protein
MQNRIPSQIWQTITFHTNRLGRMFRLQPADRDDVRQELTLKALEAMRCYRPDMNASIITYTKQAVCRRAIDLIREMITQPVLGGMPFNGCLEAVGWSISFIMDAQSLIRTLPPRQKKICLMIMAGCEQEEIARSLGCCCRSVRYEFSRIKKLFAFYFENPKIYCR